MAVFCRSFSPPDEKDVAGSIINSIVSDIVDECKIRGERVSEPLAAFMVGTKFYPNEL